MPKGVQRLADKNFALLKANPHHPSLHLKRIGRLWSVRVGLHHRAIGIDYESGIAWIWIGSHADYDKSFS
ncbi:MAG: hypothetical protein ACOC9Q_01840 [bacterium]